IGLSRRHPVVRPCPTERFLPKKKARLSAPDRPLASRAISRLAISGASTGPPAPPYSSASARLLSRGQPSETFPTLQRSSMWTRKPPILLVYSQRENHGKLSL